MNPLELLNPARQGMGGLIRTHFSPRQRARGPECFGRLHPLRQVQNDSTAPGGAVLLGSRNDPRNP